MSILIALSACSLATTFIIEGVKSSDIKDNLQLYLKDVNKPVSEFDVDEYRTKLVQQSKKALQAFAYYDATFEVLPFSYQENILEVTIKIVMNQTALVNRVVFQSDIEDISKLPTKLAEVFTKVRALQNEPVDHNRYESLKNQLNTFALIYGYFDFKFLLHKLLIVPSDSPEGKSSSGIVHWIVTLGPRYKFGDLVFLDDTRGQELVKKVNSFSKGEYFDQTKVGELSIDMMTTGYFDNAIARPNSEQSIDFTVPIEIILSPKPKDLFKFGAGVSTDTGPRLSFDWDRPWVNLDGHSLGAKLYLSDPRKTIGLDYRIPKENPLKDFLSFQLGYKQVRENQTNSDTTSFAMHRQWGAREELDWDKILFLKTEQETFTQGLQYEQKTLLVIPGFTLNRTRKRGDIFVDWGDRQLVTVEGASSNLLSDIDLFKITARTKWIRQFDRHRFVFRADAGVIATDDFEQVPSSQRFFAGGDSSIRGFGLNGVTDIRQVVNEDGVEENELIGGKYLSVASIEYAYRVADNWRVAVFADAGSASDKFARNIATGVGVGVHWLSPIGNVQIYFARGKSDFDKGFRVHLIIGPGL